MGLSMSDDEFERWWGPEALAEAKAKPLPKPYTPPKIVPVEEIIAESVQQIRDSKKRDNSRTTYTS